jgi:hypothetical protein
LRKAGCATPQPHAATNGHSNGVISEDGAEADSETEMKKRLRPARSAARLTKDSDFDLSAYTGKPKMKQRASGASQTDDFVSAASESDASSVNSRKTNRTSKAHRASKATMSTEHTLVETLA